MNTQNRTKRVRPTEDPATVDVGSGLLARLIPLKRARVRIIDHVSYKERRVRGIPGINATPQPGVREFDVRFPGGDRRTRPMRIRSTPTRIYDDITPDPRAELVRSLDELIRPGDRVLELGCGTGVGAKHLAYLTGPSGGVVSLDRDGEAIRFARQRYAAAQLGFELGWIETLAGELDDAFDTVVLVDPLRDGSTQAEHDQTIGEIIRVIRPGGHLLCIGTTDEAGERARRILEEHAIDPVHGQRRAKGWRASLWKKPGGPQR